MYKKFFKIGCNMRHIVDNRIKSEDYSVLLKNLNNNCYLDTNTKRIYDGIVNRDRNSLSRAISLVESTHPYCYLQAQALIDKLLTYKNGKKELLTSNGNCWKEKRTPSTLRMAVTGSPGSGKSSFVEVFGEYAIKMYEMNVAVLTIDPSSPISGGSILGDKTRMPKLSTNPKAYIRSSPAGDYSGGVTKTTNEAIFLCEACGYNLIMVETVGVGQSEYSVSDMVDMMILLLPPASGDDLQAIKRGIMELCNIICVTKYDGDFKSAAMKSAYYYSQSLKFMKSNIAEWNTVVHLISSQSQYGIANVWETVDLFWQKLGGTSDIINKRRMKQRHTWLWHHFNENIKNAFLNNYKVKKSITELEEAVMNQFITPGKASNILISLYTDFLKK